MFTLFKQRHERKKKAHELYEVIRVRARAPVFYTEYGVPDNLDGRFELLSLHCFIMMSRLQREGQKKQAQDLFDVFFKSMDRSLREMGIGDMGIPKHMKRMMKGFNGRANNYYEAITSQDEEKLQNALIRNVYGTIEVVDKKQVLALGQYIVDSLAIEGVDPKFAREQQKEIGK